MKSKFSIAAIVLGAVLAAPSVAMAEDVISDEAIRLTTDQTAYNNAVTKRATKVQSVQTRADRNSDSAARLMEESFSANSR